MKYSSCRTLRDFVPLVRQVEREGKLREKVKKNEREGEDSREREGGGHPGVKRLSSYSTWFALVWEIKVLRAL